MNKAIKQNSKACGYTHSVVGKSWRQRTVKKSEGVNKNGTTNIFWTTVSLCLICLVHCQAWSYVCVWDTDIHLIRMCLIIILCIEDMAHLLQYADCWFSLLNSESQLVAGHTSDFVHSVLKATARDNPSFGDLEQLSVCF